LKILLARERELRVYQQLLAEGRGQLKYKILIVLEYRMSKLKRRMMIKAKAVINPFLNHGQSLLLRRLIVPRVEALN
jgi:hypothetical protein